MNLNAQSNIDTENTNTNQFKSCGGFEIGVGVLRSTKSISEENLKLFIDKFAKRTIRIKGFAKLTSQNGMAVQTTLSVTEFIELTDYLGSAETIVMGEDFNLGEFSRIYRELAK